MKTLIVIPARFESNRFPGKPLAVLAGKTLLERAWEIASTVCLQDPDCSAVVATETPSDKCQSGKIVDFCEAHNIPVQITSSQCHSGSDRVWEVASSKTEDRPEIVVNLQGDNPTCLPSFVIKAIDVLKNDEQARVASVYTQLSWNSLDKLRESKVNRPSSGTTVVTNSHDQALWFSKNIIPAIRDEKARRKESAMSPVKRHIGLYAYRYDALQFFAKTPEGVYERFEGLEQLRFLENGYPIQMTPGVYPPGLDESTSGIDVEEDLKPVEELIRKYGEPLDLDRDNT